MNNKLFAELLASAEEMVAIETGQKEPSEDQVHTYKTTDSN